MDKQLLKDALEGVSILRDLDLNNECGYITKLSKMEEIIREQLNEIEALEEEPPFPLSESWTVQND